MEGFNSEKEERDKREKLILGKINMSIEKYLPMNSFINHYII